MSSFGCFMMNLTRIIAVTADTEKVIPTILDMLYHRITTPPKEKYATI